jgi:hypothetical protein
VDKKFANLLRRILSDKFVNKYEKKHPQNWLALMTQFEKMKRTVQPEERSKINIPLSWQMGQAYKETMGRGIEEAIRDLAEETAVSFGNGALILTNKAIQEIFKESIDEIVEHMKGLMSMPALKQCKYFMLVGGFGESALLQKAIIKAFPDVCVLIPQEAQMAVIKGAVLFGHTPGAIASRVAKRTYGVAICEKFDKEKHFNRKQIIRNNTIYVDNIFDPYAIQGKSYENGMVTEKTYYPTEPDQTSVQINIYSVDRVIRERGGNSEDINYVDEYDMEKMGYFKVEMPDTTGGTNRKVRLDIQFGGTEILVTGTDMTTGKRAGTTIEFLTV